MIAVADEHGLQTIPASGRDPWIAMPSSQHDQAGQNEKKGDAALQSIS
jgi:hypothetical protein